MEFNHSKLVGKIRECGLSQEKVALAIKMSPSTFSGKLNNKSHFSADEMDAICNLLDISTQEIGLYFFAK